MTTTDRMALRSLRLRLGGLACNFIGVSAVIAYGWSGMSAMGRGFAAGVLAVGIVASSVANFQAKVRG